ncbi:MAG: radical SAM protein, partial [Nanoarchaeota archaeon]|nr:radical SAM protein [Nanoarchaeota archaeon]
GRKDRWTLCVSVQSGCPVGCKFCGTGKRFIRNLTEEEIVEQVKQSVAQYDMDPSESKWFQVMFMSMGEPALNYKNVNNAVRKIKKLYPNCQPLISTIGFKNEAVDEWIKLGSEINLGLQFSVHSIEDKGRDELIPVKQKYNIKEIRDAGIKWYMNTGRLAYLNFCIVKGENDSEDTIKKIIHAFPKDFFHVTLSWVNPNSCTQMTSPDMKRFDDFKKMLEKEGYDVSVFKSAGIDIGGGCGQLYYVQEALEEAYQQIGG